MKILVLDYSKWRCGDYGINRLGEGVTQLSNDEGYQCCLGQFSLQLNKKLKEEDIFNVDTPCEMGKKVPFLTNKIKDNSQLSRDAMSINDNLSTTTEEKIQKLKALFKTKNFIIRVINKPKENK